MQFWFIISICQSSMMHEGCWVNKSSFLYLYLYTTVTIGVVSTVWLSQLVANTDHWTVLQHWIIVSEASFAILLCCLVIIMLTLHNDMWTVNVVQFALGTDGDMPWYLSQVKGTIEEDVTEGKYWWFLLHHAMHKWDLWRRLVSVCLSVCPVHSCIVLKRANIFSNFFHHQTAYNQSSFAIPKVMALLRRGPTNWWRITIFDQYLALGSMTGGGVVSSTILTME